MKNPFHGWGMDIFWNHTLTEMPRSLVIQANLANSASMAKCSWPLRLVIGLSLI